MLFHDSLRKPSDDNSFADALQGFWWLFLAEGIVMIALGAAAIALPPVAGVAITVLLGWLLIGASLAGLVTTYIHDRAPGFWWSTASVLVTCATGALLVVWPFGGAVTLSLAIAVFLVLDGAIAIAMAFAHRRHFARKWTWLLVNGLVDLVLAAISIVPLPDRALWALGIILGVDMLAGGVTLVAIALDARRDGKLGAAGIAR